MEETLGFFAKQDPHSLGHLEDVFLGRDGFKFLIESNKEIVDGPIWLTKRHEWSTDANNALHFDTFHKAFKYANENKITNFVITEHEFVNKE